MLGQGDLSWSMMKRAPGGIGKAVVDYGLPAAVLAMTMALVAVASAGVPAPTMVPGRTIASWDFTKATEELITNSVAGMPTLKAGTDAPATVKDGLQFNNGACLRGAGLPGLLDGKTSFELSMELKPLLLPSGHCGGLFQCFEYQKAGFRFYLYRFMTLGVDIHPGQDKLAKLNGTTKLELGKAYEVKLWFTPTYAYMYLDGKLDGAVKTGLPAATKAEIIVGIASGQDYYYNGIIKYLTIKELVDKKP